MPDNNHSPQKRIKYITVELSELLDLIKDCQKNAIIRSNEDETAITIEVSGFQNSGDIFFLDGDVVP